MPGESAAAGDLDRGETIPLKFADYAAGRDPVMERLRLLLEVAAQ